MGLWARHARAAGDGRHHRHDVGQVRFPSALMEAFAELQDHQHVGGIDSLPHDGQYRYGEPVQLLDQEAVVQPASRSIRRRWTSSTGLSMCRRAACTGTTEIGVVLVNYPGAPDFHVKPGSLGKAIPGQKLEVQRPDGTPSAPGEGRRADACGAANGWETTKDLAPHRRGRLFFITAAVADDVIISAGWTMSPVEIENTMLKHPDVALRRRSSASPIPPAARVVKRAMSSPSVRGRRRLCQGASGFHAGAA